MCSAGNIGELNIKQKSIIKLHNDKNFIQIS